MTIQKLPGTAITPGTITVVQLESTVATTVSTGGGPKITNLAITSNVNATLDDTAVDLTGGFIRLTGTGFNTGCLVYAGLVPAASTTFISNTEVRAQLSAQSAGTYPVYLVNTDGGTAIRVPGVTYSASPAWQTASSLGDQYDGVLLNLSVVATDAVSYSVVSGSLPPGLSLNSNTGVISGTISGVVNDTVYTFTINAVDAQLQDSPRVFTINVTVSDPYFRLTTLLLTGNSGNTVVTDSSTNNFAISVVGDSRASNFSPYLTGWSNYFDGTGDYLSITTTSADFNLTGDFTIEFYANPDTQTNSYPSILACASAWSAGAFYVRYSDTQTANKFAVFLNPSDPLITASITSAVGIWHHVAVTRSGSNIILWVNGLNVGNATNSTTINLALGGGVWIGNNGSTSCFYKGYTSNLRVIKGTALYTANFTPATSTLTAVANTSLLTCHANRLADGSANNFAITKNGDVSVVSFNPFNLTNTGTTGSMYFDGTGDCLSIPTSAISTVGSNNFSMECWVYPLRQTNTYSQGLISYGVSGSTSGTSYISFELSSFGYAAVAFAQGSSLTITSSTITPINQWSHIALCRSGSTLSIFLNGNRVATTSTSATIGSSGNVLFIGSSWYANEAARNLQGYISNARIVNGASAYDATQSTITVPTAPLTAVTNTQLLTLQNRQPPNNHTFQDSSSNNFLITRSGNATQGTFSPFSQSGWSNYFNGSSYLTVPDDVALDLDTGNFTIEAWIYPTSVSPAINYTILAKGSSSATGTWQFDITSSSKLRFQYDSAGAITSTASLVANTWTHVAVVREGTGSNQTKLYINGGNDGTGSVSSNFGDATTVKIGLNRDGTTNYVGYISNARVVKGVAVYTGNFTVPTSALTATQSAGTNISAITTGQTSLLTCQSNRFRDASANNFTITTSGSPSVQAFSPFSPTATYSSVTHGGSAYFDGNGDYLSLVDNDQLNYGSNPFTIEVWAYGTSSSATQNFVSQFGTNIKGINFGTNYNGTAANRIQFVYSKTGGDEFPLTDPSTMVLNQWNHIAVVRTANTISLFVNGARVATTTETGAINNSPRATFNIGAYSGNSGEDGLEPFQGYLAGLRSIKGTAIYDATQTTLAIPTAPVIATTNTSLLLNFTNDAIEDATGRNVIETVADARTTSVVTKWAGSHSMSFDGTGDRINIPLSPFHSFGSADFTIEGWVYLNSIPGFGTLVATRTSGGDGTSGRFSLAFRGSALEFFSGSSTIIVGGSVSTGAFIHFVASRSSGSLRLFLNGTQVGSTTSFTTSLVAGALTIGDNQAGNEPLNGYLQDVRITIGYARYTANFTPPTVPPRLK